MFYSFLFVGVYHYQRGDLPELCILFVNHIHFYFGDAVCMGLPVGLRVGLGRWRVLSSGAWGVGLPVGLGRWGVSPCGVFVLVQMATLFFYLKSATAVLGIGSHCEL